MLKWLTRSRLLSRVDAPQVIAAIGAAELKTSGEIRVSMAPFFWGSVQREAERAFHRLGMDATRQRNAVLIFVVPARRKFALVGDEGIHAAVGQAFWDKLAALLSIRFRGGDFTGGLTECIHEIGVQLAAHFPHAGEQDVNELSDQVDFGPTS